MARRSTKTSKKKTGTAQRTKALTGRKSQTKSKPAGGTARAAKSSAGKPSSRAKVEEGKRRIALPQKLTLDRKLDILGVVLAMVGIITLLSLVSTSRSEVTGGWINLLRIGFGWGVYLLPLALIGIGLWLILRNFERIPTITVERAVGVSLLYANMLAIFHFLIFPSTSEMIYELVQEGKGGGYIGAVAIQLLQGALGKGGAAIALLAWFLIALALTLDVPVAGLFGWMTPFFNRMQDVWDEYSAQRAKDKREQFTSSGYTPVADSTPVPLAVATAGAPLQNLQMMSPGLYPMPTTWELPDIAEILDAGGEVNYDDDYDRRRARVIEETLTSFGAPAKVVEISRGPTITQFGVEPDFVESRGGRMRVRVGKISALADDLALALSARTIRIQAPVPGKGYVGIEVPNDEISLVALRDVVESEAFLRLKSSLRIALGQDVAGNAAAADLAAMPHLLIAGATGAGKSVCVNSLICCLLLRNTPDDLRMIMVDPKRVELTGYNGIPHLLAPVVVELERVVGALQWITREMDQRYHKLAQAGCRNLKEYNAKLAASNEKKLPYLVVVIDELADLMMLAPDETERTLTRLAQLARATGIHLIISTQRPSVDVVTGLIKANFPARIAFAVASGVDSRVILDQPGAERLLGRGDMLFQAPDAAAPVRLQGTYVSDEETQRLVLYWQRFSGGVMTAPTAAGGIVDSLPAGIPLKQMPLWEEMTPEEEVDPLLAESIDLVRREGRASISMLQRRFRIGYTRAARLVETMEERGIIGSADPNTGTREILDYGPAAPPADEVD